MLGEQIGELQGKITGARLLPSEEVGWSTREISFRSTGNLLGLPVTFYSTYIANLKPDGTLTGRSQCVVEASNGEFASATGSGVAKFNEKGGISWRGVLYHQSSGQTLSRLNAVAVVYEYDLEGQENVEVRLWEWK